MRCNPQRACGETVKYAGKVARQRKICGSCMYAVMTIAKDCINNTPMLENSCKIRKSQ